jgi:hypothetical protein
MFFPFICVLFYFILFLNCLVFGVVTSRIVLNENKTFLSLLNSKNNKSNISSTDNKNVGFNFLFDKMPIGEFYGCIFF